MGIPIFVNPTYPNCVANKKGSRIIFEGLENLGLPRDIFSKTLFMAFGQDKAIAAKIQTIEYLRGNLYFHFVGIDSCLIVSRKDKEMRYELTDRESGRPVSLVELEIL